MPAEPATVARTMMIHDRASESLGMTVLTNEAGHAVVTMTIREDMLNGFAITHGGFVFALADTAFAIACNDSDLVTVAAGADITFLKATTAGDVLTATAIERAKSGRSGIYDVEVLDAAGAIVAEFRGRSRRTNSPAPV
ncbi:MAG: acyl-CoA thioesterase [Actinomycetota bacterium]|nr:acyl-CoA thioesterase [Actinomycetota bacterium]